MPLRPAQGIIKDATLREIRAAKPAEVFVKFLVKFDLDFDLKFEVSDGKNLAKFGLRTFLPASKALEISGQSSEQNSGKNSETSFQISLRLLLEISFSRRRC